MKGIQSSTTESCVRTCEASVLMKFGKRQNKNHITIIYENKVGVFIIKENIVSHYLFSILLIDKRRYKSLH